MSPYGSALLDYHNGNQNAKVIIHRDDDSRFELPMNIFFNNSSSFSRIEKKAIELCHGKVLDVGAGSGRHSLYLREKGFDVFSIDISPEAAEIMKIQGLNNVECSGIFDFNKGEYDSILLLGHGIGMVGSLEGFRRFLNHTEKLLRSNGIIVFDSLDVRCTKDPKNLDYQKRNKKRNRYIGEIHMRFEYNGVIGSPYSWLHIDPDTLETEVSKLGWHKEIIHQEDTGDYLVKLFI